MSRSRQFGVVAIAAALMAAGAAAQPPPSAAEQAGMLRKDLFKAIPASGARPPASLYELAHMAGREDLSLYRMSRELPCTQEAGDALAAIVERARSTSIVIINEDHGAPLHRQFVGELLRALKPLGYSIYAAEGFGAGGTDHAEPLMSDGYYTQEPMFGRTMRLAAALGYERVAYDEIVEGPLQPPSRDNAEIIRRAETRERTQSDRLMARIFRARPGAKVLIHVGGSHMLEQPIPEQMNMRWMASFLKEATGVDPLTIDQTACQAGGSLSLAAQGRQGRDGPQTAQSQGVDMFVGHPKVEYAAQRPTWRRAKGDHEVAIPAAFASSTDTVIIEARAVGVEAGAVPMDRILVRPGEHPPLLLQAGRWRVEGFTAAGPIGPAVEVQVE